LSWNEGLEIMKTKIITVTALALLASSNMRNAVAGDREWATAGKVLTGLAAASIITRALEPRPVYYTPPPMVVYQTVPTTATAVVTSQPVYATTTIPVATIPDAPTIPNAPTLGAQTVVVYQQPAVVYAPAPVMYVSAPVYCAPPRISFGFSIGGGHHHHGRHHRGRW
jgi:hypothetical protein